MAIRINSQNMIPTFFEPIRFEVENKLEIRSALKRLGITHEKMYPELETTAKSLKDKYKDLPQQSYKPEDKP